jgi:hypothetical protein
MHTLLNPSGHEIFQQGWQLASPHEASGRWRPLSLDPSSTADLALRWFYLALVAFVAANMPRGKRGWIRVLMGTVLLGGLVAAVGGLHHLIGASEFLGWMTTRSPLETWSTFINPNHAAVFYGFVSLASFALAYECFRLHPRHTILASACGIIFMLLAFHHDSLGANLAFGVVLVLVGLMVLTQTRWVAERFPATRKYIGWFALAWVILAPVSLFVFLLEGVPTLGQWIDMQWLDRWVETRGLGRLEMTRAALQATGDFWPFGAGGGSTGSVLTSYLDWTTLRPGSVPTVENELAEWLLHYGVAAGSLALTFSSVYLWAPLRLYRARLRFRYLVVFACGAYLFLSALLHFPFLALGVSGPIVFVIEFGRQRLRDRQDWGRPLSERGIDWQRGHMVLAHRTARAVVVVAVVLIGSAAVAYYGPLSPARQQLDQRSTPEQIREAIALTPAAGQNYARLALNASRQGDHQQAADLASYAYQRAPLPQYGLMKAKMLAASGDQNEAVETYRRLLDERRFRRGIERVWVKYLISDLSEPAQLARAVQMAAPADWKRVYDLLRRKRGLSVAIDFTLELVELHPQRFDAGELLVQAYLRNRQPSVADLWARSLLYDQQEKDGLDLGKAYVLHAEVQRRQGRDATSRSILADGLKRLPDNQSLARAYLLRLPEDPAEFDQTEIALLERALQVQCSSAVEAHTTRELCWRAEATLAEKQGHLDDAELVLRRMHLKLGRPVPLASFYARYDRCLDLQKLLRQHRQSATKSKYRAKLSRLAKVCASDK